MSKHTTDMIKLGIFVILGFSLFIYGVYAIGSKKNMFGNNITLYADFPDVSGLQAGNNVRFMGINVGSVKKVEISNDTTLRVQMNISSSAQANIKKDALVSIGTDGLVGASLINIVPGNGTEPVVEDGDLLISKVATPMRKMMESLDQTNQNIVLLSKNLLEITHKINEGDGLVGKLLNDASLSRKMDVSVKNVKQVTDTLKLISSEVNQILKDLRKGKGLLGYMLTDTNLTTKVETMVSEVDSLIDHQLAPSFSDLAESAESFKVITEDIKVLTRHILDGQGALGVLINDPEAEKQIKQIIANIDSSSVKLDENLKALRRNWFFRKYFKEKEKENKE